MQRIPFFLSIALCILASAIIPINLSALIAAIFAYIAGFLAAKVDEVKP